MSKIIKGKIKRLDMLSTEIYRMRIESEYVSCNAEPGQFINLKCSDEINHLLRRPISICFVDQQTKTFDIVFMLKGKGTNLLCRKETGSMIDFIGPLGTPFDLSESYKKIAVIGGGIGIFPLLFLLQKSKARQKSAFIGFKKSDFLVLQKEFEDCTDRLKISTDDGSFGYKGLVTDLLLEDLQENKYDIIYSCGPAPMLKKIKKIAKEKDIKCQMSLEQRMGCGIGACLVCVCKIKTGDDWEYKRVCTDGPVFWSDEIILED